MAVVCLRSLQISQALYNSSISGIRTCSRPCNSRSPRNLTNTTSFSDRRTKSSGSLTGLPPAAAAAPASSGGEDISSARVMWWLWLGMRAEWW